MITLQRRDIAGNLKGKHDARCTWCDSCTDVEPTKKILSNLKRELQAKVDVLCCLSLSPNYSIRFGSWYECLCLLFRTQKCRKNLKFHYRNKNSENSFKGQQTKVNFMSADELLKEEKFPYMSDICWWVRRANKNRITLEDRAYIMFTLSRALRSTSGLHFFRWTFSCLILCCRTRRNKLFPF